MVLKKTEKSSKTDAKKTGQLEDRKGEDRDRPKTGNCRTGTSLDYIRKWFLKKVTKENRLVLILHLYYQKLLFSADAERYSKVVCLNVYVQGTIWIANANCEYFAITKVCCMQFLVCSLVS